MADFACPVLPRWALALGAAGPWLLSVGGTMGTAVVALAGAVGLGIAAWRWGPGLGITALRALLAASFAASGLVRVGLLEHALPAVALLSGATLYGLVYPAAAAWVVSERTGPRG